MNNGDLQTAEQYRTLADLIERRGRQGALVAFRGWLLLAQPGHPLVRVLPDGTWDDHLPVVDERHPGICGVPVGRLSFPKGHA